jgi:hypothetical protein
MIDPTKMRRNIKSNLQTLVTETTTKKDDEITNDMVEMSSDADKVT